MEAADLGRARLCVSNQPAGAAHRGPVGCTWQGSGVTSLGQELSARLLIQPQRSKASARPQHPPARRLLEAGGVAESLFTRSPLTL